MKRRTRKRWRLVAVQAALVFCACACGSDEGGNEPPLIAVLSAFPAELAPLLEQAAIEATTVIEGRTFRTGKLAGVPVVLALTGIGLVNAAATTSVVLDRFGVTGIVVSGVAGSPERIGDVTVPLSWSLADGVPYAAHSEWIDLATAIARDGVPLERCTVLPSSPEAPAVCVLHEPAIVVGGEGRSSDPFGGAPFQCQPDGGDVFGCDVVPVRPTRAIAAHCEEAAPASLLQEKKSGASSETAPPAAEDMETAAIAREATRRGVPFIAFRATSDGTGDPLGLPGFPAQFFAYYRLAAHNAAAAAVAFLQRLAES